ncbi:hypothetical protein K474DRAFT_1705730 [Panus rudis PR-1116 ss-1]|nr:hypothetical protein K474DRAFT_1705730 [Panus rudis PR-1116 ss-1]
MPFDIPFLNGPLPQGPQPMCFLDMVVQARIPGHQPIPEEVLKQAFLEIGATEENWREGLDHCNETYREQFRQAGGQMTMLGVEPQANDPVSFVDIPGMRCSLRFYDGDMQHMQQYCFDWYDRQKGETIRAPPGLELWPSPLNPAGPMMMGGQLRSWESAMVNIGYLQIEDVKQEKYAAPEGAYVSVVQVVGNERRPILTFQVPTRNIGFHHVVHPVPA